MENILSFTLYIIAYRYRCINYYEYIYIVINMHCIIDALYFQCINYDAIQ